MNFIELLRSYQNPNFPCNTNSDTINKRYSTRLSENNLEVMYYFINLFRKNHTHVKKMGHTSEFPFDIYWWTLKNLKNQNFEKKKKKIAEDIIILHICAKSHNHMKYNFWETELERIFMSFWAIFCPPAAPAPPLKKPGKPKTASEDAIILNLCNKNTIIWYMLTQVWSVTDIIFVILGHFLLFYPTIDPEN